MNIPIYNTKDHKLSRMVLCHRDTTRTKVKYACSYLTGMRNCVCMLSVHCLDISMSDKFVVKITCRRIQSSLFLHKIKVGQLLISNNTVQYIRTTNRQI